MLKILLLFFSCSLFAENKELRIMQKRQTGFFVWVSEESARAAKLETGRRRAKEARQAHERRMEERRERFKRVERSNRHLEAAYLAAQEKQAQKRYAQQEKFSQNQHEMNAFVEKHIIPQKALEYDIKDPLVDDEQ